MQPRKAEWLPVINVTPPAIEWALKDAEQQNLTLLRPLLITFCVIPGFLNPMWKLPRCVCRKILDPLRISVDIDMPRDDSTINKQEHCFICSDTMQTFGFVTD